MVVLHGYGDSLKAYRSIKSDLRLPEFNYLLINAPKRVQDGYSWGVIAPRKAAHLKETRERLFQLVEELKEAGWHPSQIFWLGHSQGCLAASDLILHHPAAFGGFIGVSGYAWFSRGWRNKLSRSGARRTPWLFTHGTKDEVIRTKEIREDIAELSRGKVPVFYCEFLKGHDFDYDCEVPFIRRWIKRHRNSRKFSPPPRYRAPLA